MVPSTFMWIVSSMSVYMKTPCISHVATSLFSPAPRIQDNTRDSIATVDELVSSFVLQILCFLPSIHPFILPHLFCFKNIKYYNADFFSSFVISLNFFGSITNLSCSYLSSFKTASLPFCSNTFRPLDTLYCVSIVDIIWLVRMFSFMPYWQ